MDEPDPARAVSYSARTAIGAPDGKGTRALVVTGKLTAEHVFGNWLSRIGLDLEPVPHGAGPLNLSDNGRRHDLRWS